MNVKELVRILERYPERAEVRLMTQPNYPFEYDVAGVVSGADAKLEEKPDREGDIVYLCEGEQICYGSDKVWDHV
jgi:hypothetical protein